MWFFINNYNCSGWAADGRSLNRNFSLNGLGFRWFIVLYDLWCCLFFLKYNWGFL
jgi:hypothetical protein